MYGYVSKYLIRLKNIKISHVPIKKTVKYVLLFNMSNNNEGLTASQSRPDIVDCFDMNLGNTVLIQLFLSKSRKNPKIFSLAVLITFLWLCDIYWIMFPHFCLEHYFGELLY